MDMDQATLKEMGVSKVGDRVRIGAQVKQFRNSASRRTSKRTVNRNSLAMLDGLTQTPTVPSTTSSPGALLSARSNATSRAEKRMSRRMDGFELAYSALSGRTSRPNSPLVDQDSWRQRYTGLSPPEHNKKEQSPSYFGHSKKDTPQSARFGGHIKYSPSFDNFHTWGALPPNKAVIRVIYDRGTSSVINIEGCTTADEVIVKTLKKGQLNEQHLKNYCFYILDGVKPESKFCRRLNEMELMRICTDRMRGERARLMLRKLHAGEPEGEQLQIAARIAEVEMPAPPAIEVQQPMNKKTKSQLKIEKLTGEPLAAVAYPMSPASQRERERVNYFATQTASAALNTSARARRLKDFYGARPPTELIAQDLTSYFPDVEKEEMDRTLRMSIRRSRRLSKAVSRLSTMSTFSIASSLKDAPPLPTIADTWLKDLPKEARGLRPLSVIRLGNNRHSSAYRDSVSSSVLERLDEESPLEPNRKSYVSFSAESAVAHDDPSAATDAEGHTMMQSYFDDTGSLSPVATEAGDSLNSRLVQAIADDGEESDEELMDYLVADSWENLKYMKGPLIGQGSFGSVYLALHAITAELVALKQVEMPSVSGTHLDAKKNNMVEALKREIGLLKELRHPNIVQYLGSNSDDSHLNIFLEYVAGGSVASMLASYGSFGEALISNFVRQILTGLAYLHSRDIIHRDIKGANILVDNHGGVKISDFGISKRVEASSLLQVPNVSGGKRGGPRVSMQGSVFWMAPEVVRQTAYTRKADIWSLGCLIVEMFTGSHPHPSCTQLQAIFKIGSAERPNDARPEMPESCSPEARAFLEKTFEIEHEKRPSADELLTYAFCAPKG